MGVATAAAVLAAVPPIALLAGIHRALHGPGSILGALDAFLANPWIWAPALVLGVIVHELCVDVCERAEDGETRTRGAGRRVAASCRSRRVSINQRSVLCRAAVRTSR